jgi:hypothetical protein
VDYKALIGLSLLWVTYFHARRGASLKVIHPDTTFPRQPRKYEETHQRQ